MQAGPNLNKHFYLSLRLMIVFQAIKKPETPGIFIFSWGKDKETFSWSHNMYLFSLLLPNF